MSVVRIIPCLDVKNGQVVKGVNFQNLSQAGDPFELAYNYDQQKADELVFLDIAATNENRNIILDFASRVARKIFIPFTIGGGISSVKQAGNIIYAGADKVAINTAAVNNPSLIENIAYQFGSQCVVVAIDVKKVGTSWTVHINAGKKDTGIDAVQWALEVEKRGAGEILLTSMDKDGLQSGYDIEITSRISSLVNIPVIISGGCGKLEDFYQAVYAGKADAILAASVFHYGIFTIEQTKKYLQTRGVTVRM